jgi:hypothetical protein
MKNTCNKVSKASSGSYDFLKFPKKNSQNIYLGLEQMVQRKNTVKRNARISTELNFTY